jgi:hypothetical protein
MGKTRSLYDGRIQTVNAHVDCRWGRHQLLSGGYEFEGENYGNDNIDSSNAAAASAANATQLSHAVFVQDQIRLLEDRLQISGVFRTQFFALGTPLFLPAAAAPYQVISFSAPAPAYTEDVSLAYFLRGSGTQVRVHIARGYHAPSLFRALRCGLRSDLRILGVWRSFAQARALHRRRRRRRPRRLTYTRPYRMSLHLTLQASSVPQRIRFSRSVGYITVQGGISRGVEFSAAVSPARSLNLATAYTFVNAIERSPIVGNVLQTFVIPRNQFSILVTERATSRLLFTFDTLASSKYVAPVYGETITQVYRFSGIHRTNLGASYRLPLSDYKAVRFFARGENLLGQTFFESGFPTPAGSECAECKWNSDES